MAPTSDTPPEPADAAGAVEPTDATDTAGGSGPADRTEPVESSEPVDAMAVLLDSTEVFARSITVAQAAQLAAICEAVDTAKRNPEIYVLPDTTDSHGRIVHLAARAAVMELSMRLNVSESAIWAQYHEANTLIRRMPCMWKLLCAGTISYRNAKEAAAIVWTLPLTNPCVPRHL